jgi:hypothetical protein
MTKLEIELHDDVVTTLNKIKTINDSAIELIVPEGSVLFENILNLKLIQAYADRNDITVHFMTDDDIGNNLISMLNGNGGTTEIKSEDDENEDAPTSKKKVKLPAIKIPRIGLPKVTLLKGSKVGFLLLVIIPLVLAYYVAGNRLPKATARIIVDSSHFTRSLTITVTSDGKTDIDAKMLEGKTLDAYVEDSAEIETTGEKLIGDKAKGEVTIYNNTDSEKEFEKGTVLKGEDDREYVLDDDITVPAREQLAPDPTDPSIISYQKGENSGDIIASDIGKDYNIDSGEELEIDDENSSEFTAFTKTDIDGGSSETVAVVAEEDLENLTSSLEEALIEEATNALKEQVQKGYKFIDGSTSAVVTEESFSHDIGDETDKLTLTQTASAQGLVYKEEDLDGIIDRLVEDMVPDGFELSDKERDIKVEVLGNSTNSIVSATQADIQVTLKTFVVPIIDKEDLINRIKNKNPEDAHKVLGSIKNVKKYELSIAPSIPLFKKVPNDSNRIEIIIERS